MTLSLHEAPHPLQPLLRHESGRKFHANAIVVALMKDHRDNDPEHLALLEDTLYAVEDRAQLAQLLGAFEHELVEWGLAEGLPAKPRLRRRGVGVPRHPVQPLVLDAQEVVRFKKNPLVRFLLDDSTRRRSLDLNRIAIMGFPADDFNQLAQLIGYSHSGAPSYVPDRVWNAAAREWGARQERVKLEAGQELQG